MCQSKGMHRGHESWGSCCCGIGFESSPFFRHFISKKEKKEMLEDYMEQLKKELKGIEEHIQELKGK